MHTRTNVDAVTSVKTHALLGQTFERVIECLDAQLGPLAAVGHT